MLLCGLLMPAHLRAVDVSVIQDAGRQTPGVVRQGLEWAEARNLGAARLFWEAAQMVRVPDRQQLGAAVTNLAAQKPGWMILGSPDPRLEKLAGLPAAPSAGAGSPSEPFTEFLAPAEVRDRAMALMETSLNPAAQELLRCRDLTNTAIFPPASSSSGEVLDTALLVCGLLMEEKRLDPALSNAVYELAYAANHGGHAPPAARPGPSAPSWNSEPLEQVLLDLMSLGQRFDWGQLEVFTSPIRDTNTLRRAAYVVRQSEGDAPVVFAASVLTGQPGAVAGYLLNFSETGLADLGSALGFGAGGVMELLARNQRWYDPPFRPWLARACPPFGALLRAGAEYCLLMPWFALGVKWFFYFASGFLLAAALHFSRRTASPLEQPLQVRGVHVAREVLFALGFLLVVLILSEPFLSQESQKAEPPPLVRLPLVGRALPAVISNLKTPLMNQQNLLTLLLFFVLQALVYTACLVKLAEIRRQRVPARIKIKLLENEDHLFDAGLYLGFVGTIISFILVSMNVGKFSIMVAYSSTSFGIIFVSIFKIFNLRPLRRLYLMEAEAAAAVPPEAPRPAAVPTLATPS
jgi:hypothetical protein